MGKMILVEGNPGTGKSRGIKNLDPSKTLIIKPNNKDFPFKGARKMYKEGDNVVVTTNLKEVRNIIQKANEGSKFKTIVLEDLTHFFSKREMNEADQKGFDKWVKLALDVFNSFIDLEHSLREDLYVIIIAHTQMHKDAAGNQTFSLQTPGKLLEDKIKIPSYFTYVLHSSIMENEDGEIEYYLLTNRDGSSREAKSPEGCLNLREPNDYAQIIEKIEAYQNSD